ncbi:MAG TPA: hypothetical protein VNA25_26435 [Phycisphaerae bacterium]|nr:hypothetical protein [Phycisphaerae bacterium]
MRLLRACLLIALLGAPRLAQGTEANSPADPNKAEPNQPAGLAARYPDDGNIASDPAVILHEDFEAKDFDKTRWPSISNKAGALELIADANLVHAGRQCLQVTATLGKNTGGHLFRRFKTGYEQLHARFYVKFATDIDYIHHFVHMVAQLPPTPWPTGGAGLRPAGDRKFSIGIEPWSHWGKYPPPGGWHFYCYWWKMPRSGDGKYWGAGFAKEPYAVPQRGRWYCVEFMAKCNTPGKPDGEVALWIDGNQLARHKDINWRSSGKLKLNAFWLMLYVTEHSAKKNKVNTVWFDDVVVATQYIGPRRRTRPGRS